MFMYFMKKLDKSARILNVTHYTYCESLALFVQYFEWSVYKELIFLDTSTYPIGITNYTSEMSRHTTGSHQTVSILTKETEDFHTYVT